MTGEERPNPLTVYVITMLFILAIAYFGSSNFVNVEPVPGGRGRVRIVSDSVFCQLDPIAFGTDVMVVDEMLTKTECDSLKEMHRRGARQNAPSPTPTKEERREYPEMIETSRKPPKRK